MAITQREAFAQVMEHLVSHDGGGGHGYSQANRMGDGTTETICLSDGTTVTIAGGDRDCSSAVVTALRAVGVNTFGASYTGNMREQLLKTGLFGWRKMGVKSAQRGDIYLNEKCHTAVCVSPYGSARGDLLAQFSISEKGTVTGTKGDQTGRESNIKAYYSYPWDALLAWRRQDTEWVKYGSRGQYGPEPRRHAIFRPEDGQGAAMPARHDCRWRDLRSMAGE